MADLLIEIGCEELPAVACREARAQLPDLLRSGLEQAGLEAGAFETHVGPRRLAAIVTGLPASRAAVRRDVRGPRADAPEQARAGFARKHGLEAADLEEREGFVWAVVEGADTPLGELVGGVVETVVSGLQFGKTMRWPGGRFSRPVRWLVLKIDEQVAEAELLGLWAGEHSRGHRFLGGETRVRSAATYLADLRDVKVVVDEDDRREAIRSGLDAVGSWIDPMGKFDEVVDLVEWPVVLEGDFPERYLVLPDWVVVTAMQSHQRYFPVSDGPGLAPRFAFVANGAAKPEIVIAGNRAVLIGRLEDAAFAYEKDLDLGIEAMAAELGRVSFLEGAGSLADKQVRVRELAELLADRVDAEPGVRPAVARAAELCKADLVSKLVSEFSELEGFAGSVYARQEGEPADVCEAIREHHQPVEAGGVLPGSEAGALLAVADKIDTIAAAFAIGVQPTGSRDPYGLRRAAAGVVAITLARGFELGLPELMSRSVQTLVAQGCELKRKPLESVPEAVEFVLDRVGAALEPEGVSIEELRAARGAGHTAPVPMAALARALRDARGSERLAAVRDAYGRCVRIAAKGEAEMAERFDAALLREEAERALYEQLVATDEQLADCVARRDYACALDATSGLVDPLNRFFDEVLVMDPDLALRGNRLKLVFNVAAAIRSTGDLDQLPGG